MLQRQQKTHLCAKQQHRNNSLPSIRAYHACTYIKFDVSNSRWVTDVERVAMVFLFAGLFASSLVYIDCIKSFIINVCNVYKFPFTLSDLKIFHSPSSPIVCVCECECWCSPVCFSSAKFHFMIAPVESCITEKNQTHTTNLWMHRTLYTEHRWQQQRQKHQWAASHIKHHEMTIWLGDKGDEKRHTHNTLCFETGFPSSRAIVTHLILLRCDCCHRSLSRSLADFL